MGHGGRIALRRPGSGFRRNHEHWFYHGPTAVTGCSGKHDARLAAARRWTHSNQRSGHAMAGQGSPLRSRLARHPRSRSTPVAPRTRPLPGRSPSPVQCGVAP